MKKSLLLLAAILGFATAASAQSFGVGTQNITGTLGFGGGNVIPVSLSYEYGVYEFAADHQLGVGGNAIFVNSASAIAAECNYHFVGVEKLDLYGGVRLGVSMYKGGNSTFNSFDIGANYFFAPSWAVNLEFGSGLTATCLGVTFQF